MTNMNSFDVDVKWIVDIKNIDTGVVTQDPNEGSIDANTLVSLGCTRGDPDLSGEKNCQYQYSRHRVTQTVKKDSALRKLLSNNVGSIEYSENRMKACQSACAEGRDCIRLGTAARKLYKPLYDVYQASVSQGKDEISNAEILSEYGLDADEIACKRSDTVLDGNAFSNESPTGEACGVSLFGAGLRLSWTDFSELRELANMHLEIPATLSGETFESQERGIGVFPEDAVAPYLYFTGDDAKPINDKFGGTAQVMGVRGDRFLISMQNGGCLSFPAP